MSTLGRDMRHGLGIAWIEFRRSVRKSFGTRKRQLTVLGFLALFSPLVVSGVESHIRPAKTLPGRGVFRSMFSASK